jgi:plastocyanin
VQASASRPDIGSTPGIARSVRAWCFAAKRWISGRRVARASACCAAVALVVTLGAGAGGAATKSPGARTPGMSGMSDAQMKAASAAALAATPQSGSTIVISNFSFSPGSIKVRPGQKVRVVNRDSVAHTVTSTTGKFNTGDINPGSSVTFAAPKKPGRYPYRCNIHQYMVGVVVVS